MEKLIDVRKIWSYKHPRPIDSIGYAAESGDVIIADRREAIVFLDAMGKTIWKKELSFSPAEVRVTSDGSFVFLLTTRGQLLKINRLAELEWDVWVDKDATSIAVKPDGEAIAVGSVRGRFKVVNGAGKNVRMVHTKEPIAHMKFSAETGFLFTASSFGWVGVFDGEYNPVGAYNTGETVAEIKVPPKEMKLFLPARKAGLHIIDLEASHMTSVDPGFAVSKVGVDEKGELMTTVGLDGDIALLTIKGDLLWQNRSAHSWIFCEMNAVGDRFLTVSDKGLVHQYEVTESKNRPDSLEYIEVPDKKSERNKKSTGNFDYLEV